MEQSQRDGETFSHKASVRARNSASFIAYSFILLSFPALRPVNGWHDLHLLHFGNYNIAYLHLLVNSKSKRKSRFFVSGAAIHYKGQKRRPNQAGPPAAPTPPRGNPRRPGEKKSHRPRERSAALSKSQTLAGKSQSRSDESRESRGKVARHSRKP